MDRRNFLMGSVCLASACKAETLKPTEPYNIYEVNTPQMLDIINIDQNFEVLGQGYGWSEGPAWDHERKQLYFTDVPGNKAYVWSRKDGVRVFADPSGSATTTGFREAGANGLFYTQDGQLLVCNHGERSIQSMDLNTKTRTTLSNSFMGKKFNSPNDIVPSANGDIYFTDPPYGLEGMNASPLKELTKNGVYKLPLNGGKAVRLIDDTTFPNGIALSPDEKTLYVAQSDPEAQHIYSLDLTKENAEKKLLVDLSSFSNSSNPGLPDGMVVDQKGNLFATGPGGIFVLNPEGEILGRIRTSKASANCTFGEDGHTLFITNHDRVIRLPTLTRGLAWNS